MCNSYIVRVHNMAMYPDFFRLIKQTQRNKLAAERYRQSYSLAEFAV